MVLVATQVKRRRGTTAENDAFTGAEGEITVDTEKHELRVHDGETQGGHIIPTKDYGYSKTESDNLLSNKANTSLSNIVADGKEVIAHQAMPSDRYINLTLGGQGSAYIAPADGYFIYKGSGTASGAYMVMSNEKLRMAVNPLTLGSGGGVQDYLPVKKGDTMNIWYANLTTNYFRFIYAEGAQ